MTRISFRPRGRLLLLTVLFLAPVAATAIGILRPDFLKLLFGRSAFYIMLVMVVVWLAAFVRYLREAGFSWRAALRAHYPLLILAGGITGFIFLSTPVGYKTLNDEATLLSISQSLLLEQSPFEVTQADFFNGEYAPINRLVPIRPLLFPFLLFGVHLLGGYHFFNAFILNALVMFGFLSGIGICVHKISDRTTAMAAVVLGAAHPLVAVYGTGGGYDLLATALFAGVLVLFYDFARAPTRIKMGPLWISLILLVNTRHESILYAAVVGVGMLLYIRWRWIRDHKPDQLGGR